MLGVPETDHLTESARGMWSRHREASGPPSITAWPAGPPPANVAVQALHPPHVWAHVRDDQENWL